MPESEVRSWTVHLPNWEVAPVQPDPGRETDSGVPGGGVYAAFATWYGQRVVRLGHHLSRLADSAQRMGITVPLDLQKLRTLLGTLLAESGYPEARIRVTLAADGLLVVQMSPYAGPPVDLQERGISCGLIRGASRSTPEAKQTSWIEERKRLSAAQDISHYEWLLSNSDGDILEGTSSNFYLILRSAGDDRLVLKTADTGVLAGTARAIVLEVAPQTFSVALDAPVESELETAVEACISSASRGVIPVTSVEGVPIGSGAPGRAVRWLIRAYDLRAAQLASPLTM